MPRVLHIIDGETPADMLAQLSLLAAADDTVVSIGPPPPAGRLDLPVRAVHRLFGSAAATGWRLRDAADRVAIVHTWSASCMSAGEAIADYTRASQVVSIPCRPPTPALKRLVKRRGRTITVPTFACRDALVAAGADPAWVRVLAPPAAPLDDRPATRARARDALGLGEDEFLILALAEMVRPAGHKYASWAHAVVRQIRPEVRVLFPGTGPVEDHMRFFAETTSYGDEALFAGSRVRGADALAAADMALLFAERDVGVADLVAAMAAALPIAATDTPDISECTAAGQAVMLVPRGDMSEGFLARGASTAVLKFLENPELAESFSAAARRRAEECFSLERSRAALAEAYSAAAAVPQSFP